MWVVVLGALALPASASAATIDVTTALDEYTDPDPGMPTHCSLREAVTAANTDGVFGGCSTAINEASDTIELDSGVTYGRTRTGLDDTNDSGDLDTCCEPVTITTPGASPAYIMGTGLAAGDRVLQIYSSSATISKVQISNGYANSDGGGGIRVNGSASLELSNSTVRTNTSEFYGGGIESAGPLTATNVTLSDNHAKTDGGGLDAGSNTATLNNVTISSNFADSDANMSGSGGGINEFGASTVNLSNTLVDLNTAPSAPDCLGDPDSLGFNLIGSTAGCAYTATSGDLTDIPSNMGGLALGNNGGGFLIQSHPLLSGSAAIDAGNPAAPGSGPTACATTDTHGIARPRGPRCDIGAFEAPVPITTAPVSVTSTTTAPTTAKKKCKKKKRSAAAAKKKRCKKKRKK